MSESKNFPIVGSVHHTDTVLPHAEIKQDQETVKFNELKKQIQVGLEDWRKYLELEKNLDIKFGKAREGDIDAVVKKGKEKSKPWGSGSMFNWLEMVSTDNEWGNRFGGALREYRMIDLGCGSLNMLKIPLLEKFNIPAWTFVDLYEFSSRDVDGRVDPFSLPFSEILFKHKGWKREEISKYIEKQPDGYSKIECVGKDMMSFLIERLKDRTFSGNIMTGSINNSLILDLEYLERLALQIWKTVPYGGVYMAYDSPEIATVAKEIFRMDEEQTFIGNMVFIKDGGRPGRHESPLELVQQLTEGNISKPEDIRDTLMVLRAVEDIEGQDLYEQFDSIPDKKLRTQIQHKYLEQRLDHAFSSHSMLRPQNIERILQNSLAKSDQQIRTLISWLCEQTPIDMQDVPIWIQQLPDETIKNLFLVGMKELRVQRHISETPLGPQTYLESVRESVKKMNENDRIKHYLLSKDEIKRLDEEENIDACEYLVNRLLSHLPTSIHNQNDVLNMIHFLWRNSESKSEMEQLLDKSINDDLTDLLSFQAISDLITSTMSDTLLEAKKERNRKNKKNPDVALLELGSAINDLILPLEEYYEDDNERIRSSQMGAISRLSPSLYELLIGLRDSYHQTQFTYKEENKRISPLISIQEDIKRRIRETLIAQVHYQDWLQNLALITQQISRDDFGIILDKAWRSHKNLTEMSSNNLNEAILGWIIDED